MARLSSPAERAGDERAVELLAQVAPTAVLHERDEQRRVEGDLPTVRFRSRSDRRVAAKSVGGRPSVSAGVVSISENALVSSSTLLVNLVAKLGELELDGFEALLGVRPRDPRRRARHREAMQRRCASVLRRARPKPGSSSEDRAPCRWVCFARCASRFEPRAFGPRRARHGALGCS